MARDIIIGVVHACNATAEAETLRRKYIKKFETFGVFYGVKMIKKISY